jgi:hypothetical protein
LIEEKDVEKLINLKNRYEQMNANISLNMAAKKRRKDMIRLLEMRINEMMEWVEDDFEDESSLEEEESCL